MPHKKPHSKKISSLRATLHALPKVDLHRHLEGSLRLQTLVEIAREHGIDLPSYQMEYLRPLVTVTNDEPDFHRFLQKFNILRKFYTNQRAIERVAYEAVTDAATDNIKYLELRFNPVAQARAQGFSLDKVTSWICNAVAQAQDEHDIHANLILQVGRSESIDTAMKIADVAIAHRDKGVVGLDLAGDEIWYPGRRFAKVFQHAQQAGLNATIHAGEAGGAENVREAIELLDAQRIGHGVQAIASSEVVQLIREREVSLEICPTSNLQTGVVTRFGAHPLPDLMALNLRVTLNTDDPSISDTTLTDEYVVAMLTMGITLEQIKCMIVTAAEGSFQAPDKRKRLATWLHKKLELN